MVIRTDARQFLPVCVSPEPDFFFHIQLVIELPILTVTTLYNFFDLFPFYSIIRKLLKESQDLYLTSTNEWKAVINTFNAFPVP